MRTLFNSSNFLILFFALFYLACEPSSELRSDTPSNKDTVKLNDSIPKDTNQQNSLVDTSLTSLLILKLAFQDKQSNIQVLQEGFIERILGDDTFGDRHQRLIVKLSNSQTLLIAHNIDIAPRIPNPVIGAKLRFYGEYEWNSEGGIIHWTHHDPAGLHVAGFLDYAGKLYQ